MWLNKEEGKNPNFFVDLCLKDNPVYMAECISFCPALENKEKAEKAGV